jgi:phytoene dehydrogenase-like protein
MSSNNYDVIIIGGGCAGLKAAETLYSNGVKNILLLEALDRLGGRLHTIWINDDPKVPIELGANWIHGLEVKGFKDSLLSILIRFLFQNRTTRCIYSQQSIKMCLLMKKKNYGAKRLSTVPI